LTTSVCYFGTGKKTSITYLAETATSDLGLGNKSPRRPADDFIEEGLEEVVTIDEVLLEEMDFNEERVGKIVDFDAMLGLMNLLFVSAMNSALLVN